MSKPADEIIKIAQEEAMSLQLDILRICCEHRKKSSLDPANAELMASRGVNAACRATVEAMEARIDDVVAKANGEKT